MPLIQSSSARAVGLAFNDDDSGIVCGSIGLVMMSITRRVVMRQASMSSL